jgi:acyl-CoA thioesterase-2
MKEGFMQDSDIPQDPVADLVRILDIEQLSPTTFLGQTQWMPHGRVFGGQVLSQSLVAATKTIETGRSVHSLHSYFLRPGDIHKSIEFEVDILRDGRSFSARRVQASQEGKAIFSMIASFQTASAGMSHADAMPENLPAPEDLPSAASLLENFDHPITNYWAKARPFDLRHTEEPIYLAAAKEHVAKQCIWFKPISALPEDERIQLATLAYASDYSILESIMRRHGISWAHKGLSSASLDHAMWFHDKPDFSDWLLYVQHSPAAQNSRGLALGQIFNRSGKLVASVAQEGMLRSPEFA